MLVEKIKPQGYCKGVILALEKCIETINNPNTKKPVYLLGMIIHNRFVCDELSKKDIIILDGNDKEKLLDQIDSGTVIISAHGVSNKVKEKALVKGLDIVDTTCPDVKKVHDSVLEYLEKGYEILYIGKENHPEAIGILEESAKIHLIDSLEKLDTLDKNIKYYVTNQTTLAHSYIEVYHTIIKELFPNAIIENNICLATTKREVALYDVKTDLIVVVGDYHSSNTQKLVEIAKNKAQSKSVIAIERACDLLNYDLSKYHTACVTSGASTPNEIVDQVIRFLNSDGLDLDILNEELLFF